MRLSSKSAVLGNVWKLQPGAIDATGTPTDAASTGAPARIAGAPSSLSEHAKPNHPIEQEYGRDGVEPDGF